MPTTLMTPGVYIEEKNAFPNSAVAVATAVPVFIGYTEKADRSGKDLSYVPTRLSSYAEYMELFGGTFKPTYQVIDPPADNKKSVFKLNGKDKVIKISDNNTLYFHSAIKLFFANGGSDCYILSIGQYGGKSAQEIKPADLEASANPKRDSVWDILKKEYEPTMVLLPDFIALGQAAYPVYVDVLKHCNATQSRFGIFDLEKQGKVQTTDEVVTPFRTAMGTEFLNYGAAYYPWLKTSIIQPDDVTYTNIAGSIADVLALLPQADANQKPSFEGNVIDSIVQKALKDKATGEFNQGFSAKIFHQSLLAASPTYKLLLEEIRARMNELPPSAAMAGIYSLVDSSRGVWKAPANVSVSNVTAPSLNISHEQQQSLNVDVIGGKSINVIRPFPGIGTLVWGARTLDGNSQDWRYINVRRTLIMIEQSLKLATRAYVFEPNDSNTWVTVSSMFNNFLTNLWKQGALAGSVPEQAFNVQVGLGSTMTPNDILDGIMRITVKVAIVRPAEFIVITFQQQQQQS